MIVQNVTELDKKRRKICLENGECFALYCGEVRKYQIQEGEELAEELFDEILSQVLLKRAKERMLYLLKDSDKTEQQIREKLEQGFYPNSVIELVIAFAKQYHYIDDERFARNFIEVKEKSLSRKEIEWKLARKGISREICRIIFEEREGHAQEEALERLIRKKIGNFSTITPEKRQKICAYLMRKGFSYEEIQRKVAEIETTAT